MQKPKLIAAVAVLVVAVGAGTWALVAAAGDDESDAGRPAASAGATDPVGVLKAAAAKADEQPYKLTVGTGGADGDATVLLWDPKAKRGLETTSLKVPAGEVKIERLTAGADVYVRVTARTAASRSGTARPGGTSAPRRPGGQAGPGQHRLASTLPRRPGSGRPRRGVRGHAGPAREQRGAGQRVSGVLGDRAGRCRSPRPSTSRGGWSVTASSWPASSRRPLSSTWRTRISGCPCRPTRRLPTWSARTRRRTSRASDVGSLLHRPVDGVTRKS
ncbi:hypothetical protein NKG94_28505 [Micromonospora sp. M12]